MPLAKEISYRFHLYSRFMLRWRRLFYTAIIAPLIFTLIFTTIAPPKYKAEGMLLPSSEMSNLGMISFLAGMMRSQSWSSSEGVPGSMLYSDILNSRTVIEKVLSSQYSFKKRKKTISGDLYKILKLPHNETAVENFREMVSTKMNLENGLIKLSVKAKHPELASQIINNWILALDDFNKNIRKTQATENLIYLEKRLEESRKELDSVTDSLLYFLNMNRGYPDLSNPQTRYEGKRLEMLRTNKETVVQLLTQEYEMARLTKQKTTPIVSVLDTAIPPSKKASPKRTSVFMISMIFSLIVLSLILSVLESKNPTSPNEPLSFSEIKSALTRDFDDFWGFFRRRR